MRYRLEAEYGIKISTGRVYRLMKGMQMPKMSTEKKPWTIVNIVDTRSR